MGYGQNNETFRVWQHAHDGAKLLTTELHHPADMLTKALERTANLLAVLGDLYDPVTGQFSGGNDFANHAIVTATSLVANAQDALNDLHFSCDLTMLDHPDQGDLIMPSHSSFDTASPSGMHEPEPAPIVRPAAQEESQELVAKSYLELLRKLTAAEVFAAEQQALSLPGASPELLPLLRSLREDLQKIHNAA